jgi:hypothetical protein
MIEDYKKETGNQLGKVAKAKNVGRRMREAGGPDTGVSTCGWRGADGDGGD